MKAKQFVAGLCLGMVVGALAATGVYRDREDPPVHLDLSGTVQIDSATHEDLRQDGGPYLDEPVLLDWIYLTSETIDINDLYNLYGKRVRVSGQARAIRLKSGNPYLELNVTKITPSPGLR
jgi:hypothetical protein